MDKMKIAQQTWEWLDKTGRVSGVVYFNVRDYGVEKFCQESAKRWDGDGYIGGMKRTMFEIIRERGLDKYE